MSIFDEAAARVDLGRPTARKSGRNERRPYVPVIVHPHGNRTRDEQILLKAFATRAEAIAYAERVIANRRASLAIRLADPRMRALREDHGLPREIAR